MGSRTSQLAALIVAFAGAAGMAACLDSPTNAVQSAIGSEISVNAGSDQQTGPVGKPLVGAIAVNVTNATGSVVPNVDVKWTVYGGTLDLTSTLTDSSGNATVHWTMGIATGVDSIAAALPSGISVIITATAVAGPLSEFIRVTPDTQTVVAGQTSQGLQVKTADQYGNPVANVVVTWSVIGGGVLSATSTVSDANGLGLVTLMTNTAPATYTVTASAAVGAPVVFNLTGM
jgi:hypothetical protein